MGTAIDLTGQRFGRLVATEAVPTERGRHWRCVCDCGSLHVVKTNQLTSGKTKSCGCLWDDTVPGSNKTHGRGGTYLYRIWALIIQRCENPKNPAYSSYGGRGITICVRWRDSFEAFLEDVGDRQSAEYTLGRIDNNGHYAPGNCRWETAKDQARNRRSSRHLTHDGVTITLAEWAERTGINVETIASRIKRGGWSVADALTTPVAH